MKKCSIRGCGSPAIKRGWCSKHYKRWLRHGDPNYLARKEPVAPGTAKAWLDDFLLDPPTHNRCVKWPFLHYPAGYALVAIDNINHGVHRLICEFSSGTPEPGLVAAHECGHAWCINPRHICFKTQQENINDQFRHGALPTAKLTAKQALEIYKSNEPPKALATRYKVAKCTISLIKNGYSWSYVTGHERPNKSGNSTPNKG